MHSSASSSFAGSSGATSLLNHHHHHHHPPPQPQPQPQQPPPILFGPLPQTTYEGSSGVSHKAGLSVTTNSGVSAQSPITVETSAQPPPAPHSGSPSNGHLHYNPFHRSQNRPPSDADGRPPPQPLPHFGGQPLQPQPSLGPPPSQGSHRHSGIRWSSSGISTSAERRLPFVHRFRPVGGSSGSSPAPPVHSSAQAVSAGPGSHASSYHFHRAGGPVHRVPPLLREQQRAEKEAQRLKNKMSQYETNAVGALQERFQSRGIAPTYKVVQTEGASHCPTFTYQVFVGDMVATGVGQSKKQAKHCAARGMLDKLDGRAAEDGGATSAAPSSATSPPSGAVSSSATDGADGPAPEESAASNQGSVGNTIGQLQEHCVRHGLPMPVYDLANVGGQPHQRSFQMIAKVGCLTIDGEGTSKKDAKREAATKMLEKLKEMGGSALALVTGSANGKEGVDAAQVDGNEGLAKDLAKMVTAMKIDTLTPRHSKAIQQFYKAFQGAKGSRLYALHSTTMKGRSSDYVKILADLAQEQQFEVTYVDIDEQADSGEVQCLVQLSTLPVAVCYGLGADNQGANNDAARVALNYLKMMTKKSAVGNATTSSAENGSAGEAKPPAVKEQAAGSGGRKGKKDHQNGGNK